MTATILYRKGFLGTPCARGTPGTIGTVWAPDWRIRGWVLRDGDGSEGSKLHTPPRPSVTDDEEGRRCNGKYRNRERQAREDGKRKTGTGNYY